MSARDARAGLAPASERGVTLVELMVALTVIAIGVLAMTQMFPAGTRGQTRDRMRTQASGFAQQTLEDLSAKGISDAAMTVGRHPASGVDTLGTLGTFLRSYTVTHLAAPLDNLYQVSVKVTWTTSRAETVTATTYLRQ